MPEWPAPRAEELEIDARVARVGILVFLISILLYALTIWGATILLRNNGIISSSISWTDSYILAGIFQAIRMVDRTLWSART